MARSGKYAFTDTLDNFLSHDTPGNFDLLHSLNINQVSPENIASANAITSTPQYTTPNPNLAAYRRTVDNYELGPSNDANLLAGTVRANILEAPTYNAANFVAVSGGASWFGGFIATTTGKIITGIIVTLIIGGVVAGVLLGTRGKESALAVEVTTVAATPAVNYTSTEEYTTETGSGFLVDATTSSAGGVVRRRKRENIFDDVLLDGEAIDYLNDLIGG